MRIGIDVRELEKDKMTGIGRVLLNFLNFVNSHDSENDYILFATQQTRQLFLSSRLKLKVVPLFSKIYWDQLVLSREINKENLDIFYSPSYAAPLFCRAKKVVTCHDLYFLSLSKNPLANWIRKFYCLLMWKKVNRIIAVSEYSKKEVVKFLRCKEDAVSVVYDSVEDKFKPVRNKEVLNSLRKSKAIAKDFILYVGNLSPHKNVARLIAAYNLMPAPLKDNFQLVIVGKKDKNYPALLRLVKDLNISEKVTFLDLTSDEDLALLYNACSVLVLASLWEGFGLPALEAMACGAPVVVSNTTAFPEVVGNAGLYVNPYNIEDISDKLRLLLENEDLRSDLSQKGLIQSGKFKCEYSANAILGIFKELIHSATNPNTCH